MGKVLELLIINRNQITDEMTRRKGVQISYISPKTDNPHKGHGIKNI